MDVPGRANLGAARIRGCDSIVLSEGEAVERGQTKTSGIFFFISWHGEEWEAGITPTPPWAVTPHPIVIPMSFLKGPASPCLIELPGKYPIVLIYAPPFIKNLIRFLFQLKNSLKL